MTSYKFGAGGFRLGERVEVRTSGVRGVLVGEVIHISGCNTYQIALPNGKKKDETRPKIVNIDYLLLRRLEDTESMVMSRDTELTDENSFAPKGTDINKEWIMSSLSVPKEWIPEVDEAIGVEEMTLKLGMEVFDKAHGLPVIVQYAFRDLYSKEIEYGVSAYSGIDGKEIFTSSGRAYQFIPLELKVDVYPETGGKTGPAFEEHRSSEYGGHEDLTERSFG
ncbi:MAG: hypothetical protein LBM97_02115 [Candidatus Nomurabacteria bacterium]|jgi:hypothetical protein|nr:hypothetical protein [Candidatus Nomurabacteria bacterium]